MPGELVLPLTEQDILNILPHKRGFLWVAQVDEIEMGRRAIGRFPNFSEDRFTEIREAHFSDDPEEQYVPGVLIQEGMNQLGAVALLIMPENTGKIALLARQTTRFKNPVRPWDELTLEVELTSVRSRLAEGRSRALLAGGIIAAEGEMTCMLRDAPTPAS